MSQVCQRCAAINVAGDRFCGLCGAPMPAATDEGARAGSGPLVSAEPTLACASCGTANLPTRTFCQSCGANLGAIAGREPHAVPRPGSDRTVPAIPVPAHSRASAPSRGGGRRWVVVLAVLGLLAGGLAASLPTILGSRPEPQLQPASPTPSSALPVAIGRDHALVAEATP